MRQMKTTLMRGGFRFAITVSIQPFCIKRVFSSDMLSTGWAQVPPQRR